LSILVRARDETDLDRCVEIARAVRRLDGYPPYLPGDLRTFILSSSIGAWVAELDDEVVGHVALHRRSSPPVMALASAATGQPPGRLGVVARLAVVPEARRRGVGRALLTTAANAAVGRRLSPVLDVAKQFGAALSLYERCGWACAGEVVVNLGDMMLEEYVFIGPAR
jgi:ribosomal protein S18 acetylase RimI-like enzyme